MTHPDQPSPLPADESTPSASPPPRSKRWKWVIPLVAVACIAAGVGGFLLVRANSDFTLTGRIVINGSCSSRGYQDVSEGAQIEIVNQTGEVLGVGTLTREWGGYSCAYRFTVSDVPSGERLYGVRTRNHNRGTMWNNEDEAPRGVELSFGG